MTELANTEGTADQTVDKTATEGAAADTENEDLLGDVSAAEGGEADQTDKKDDAAGDDEDDLLEGKVGKDEEKDGDENATPDDYTITPPEGMEVDEELAGEFKPVAKELGLSQEQVQGLAEKFGPKMYSQMAAKQAAQWSAQKKAWASEFKSDPEFGGKNLETSLSHVAKARDYLGPEFTGAIKTLGGNNHPDVLKALAKVGLALGEDSPGFGKPAGKATTAEERLYPNDQPKT